MISWIRGEIIDLWQINNKFFVLINCQGLGYEIQISESIYIKLKTKQISYSNIIFWVKHIKKEDSDSLFGFISKDQKDLFIKIINIKGIGAQIGMALLNKLSTNQIFDAVNTNNHELICSVPGIGQKMSERLILELKSKIGRKLKIQKAQKYNNDLDDDSEISSMIKDIDLTLQSLNYPKREIKSIFPILINEINNSQNISNPENKMTFEKILKLAMNILEKNNSNKGQ